MCDAGTRVMRPLRRSPPKVVGHLRQGVGPAEQLAHLGTETPVGETDDGIQRYAQCAGQSHSEWFPNAQCSRSRSALSLAQPWPTLLDVEQASVDGSHFFDELGEVVEAALHLEICRRVDDGTRDRSPDLAGIGK